MIDDDLFEKAIIEAGVIISLLLRSYALLTDLRRGTVVTIDYKKLKKPAHKSEELWRQHLDWMEVMGKQVEENIRKLRKSIPEESAKSHRDSNRR
tara:strand:- start:4532 stop:4816 length:285 start_codon:yes stop_codon:yes gene_type:complete